MSDLRPIGIFDSGVGGTSIWTEIHHLLPLEYTVYLADSANAPYGEKSREEILALSIKNTEKLIGMGAKIIVIACNTATTNAIEELRRIYSIPFIGIEPAIKPAISQSRTNIIGILATKGTLSSKLFAKTSGMYSGATKMIEVVGKGLVEAIEKGETESEELENELKILLRPIIEANVDYLVLGCSHYPYLIPLLKKILPTNVTIIDSGQAVANQTRLVLSNLNLLEKIQQPDPLFFTNGNPQVLTRLINTTAKKYKVTYLDF